MMATEVAERTAAFGLMDIESGNMVGNFATQQEALLAVAATARDYGAASEEVLALSLFRWDVPAKQGFVADGAGLVQRALAAAGLVETALSAAGVVETAPSASRGAVPKSPLTAGRPTHRARR